MAFGLRVFTDSLKAKTFPSSYSESCGHDDIGTIARSKEVPATLIVQTDGTGTANVGRGKSSVILGEFKPGNRARVLVRCTRFRECHRAGKRLTVRLAPNARRSSIQRVLFTRDARFARQAPTEML